MQLTKHSRNPSTAIEKTETEKESVVPSTYRKEIVWRNVVTYAIIHSMFVYGMYLCFTSAQLKTTVFDYLYATLGGIGITAGAHRLWSHHSYKAKLPLRMLLCVFCWIAGQENIYVWVRNHRVHHKFQETDADPHNIHRGFFFAHMGWVLVKKHPDVVSKGKMVSTDDLLQDPVIRINKRYYMPMMVLFNFVIPTMIPYMLWNETLWNSYFLAVWKFVLYLNITFLINSYAHMFGDREYDKNIEARGSKLASFIAVGEGFHNFHHTFPWDYGTSEFGYKFNLTKIFIDFMASIGQAYDCKQATPEMIQHRRLKNKAQ